MLKNIGFAEGLKGVEFVCTEVKAKKMYADGNPVGNEAVRIVAVAQEVGKVNIDLYPFDAEKLDRCKALFGTKFTTADLVGLSDCKIYVYNGFLQVALTATDIEPGLPI